MSAGERLTRMTDAGAIVMFDVNEFALPAPDGAKRPMVAGHRACNLVLACLRRIATWIERVRQRGALADLDGRMLQDVGITRSEAEHECAKPFWR